MKSEEPTLEIILHAGTLGTILVVYWRRILDLLTSDRRVIMLLVFGTIPAAAVGLTIKKMFPSLFHNTYLAGAMLILTGVMLIVLGKLKPREGSYQKLSVVAAILVGCFQAVAILPGISRSGSTILGGRLLGLKNEDSLTFSFLLAIPAILGATLLSLKDLYENYSNGIQQAHQAPELVAGAVVSFIIGVVALKWLIRWSQNDRLHYFAWWCIPFGILAICLSFGGYIA